VVGKLEEKRPLGRPRRRCVNNSETDVGEIGRSGVDRIGLAQDEDKWWTVVIVLMILWVP
jgi:hypothetical protein